MKKFHQNKNKKVKTGQIINKVHPEGNRRVRKIKAAHARKQTKPQSDPNRWYKRIVKEMQECKAVQELVCSGKVDKLLE